MPIETLMKLPSKAKAMWESTYKAAKKKYGEERAAKIAWAAVKKKFKKVDNKWVARFPNTPDYITTHYTFSAEQDSVARTEGGFVYRDYVLTSNKDVFTDFAFKRMVDQINSEGLKGRIDRHEAFHKAKHKGLDEAEEELEAIDQGIEAINARYEQGKVKATIKMSPEAFAKAKELNAASIEARMPMSSYKGGKYNQARLVGFVLANKGDNPDAVALS